MPTASSTPRKRKRVLFTESNLLDDLPRLTLSESFNQNQDGPRIRTCRRNDDFQYQRQSIEAEDSPDEEYNGLDEHLRRIRNSSRRLYANHIDDRTQQPRDPDEETEEARYIRVQKDMKEDAKELGRLYDQFFQMEQCGICASELSQPDIITFENDDQLLPYLSSPESSNLIFSRMDALRSHLYKLENEEYLEINIIKRQCDISYLKALFVEVDDNGLLRNANCICKSCAKKIGYISQRAATCSDTSPEERYVICNLHILYQLS